MRPQALVGELERLAPGSIRRNAPLSDLGRWRIGGPADIVVDPPTAEAAAAAADLLAGSGARWTVIGEGSNLLFDSAGYRGVILRIGPSLAWFEGDARSGIVRAGAGLWVPYFALKTLRLGLAGCVHAIGIPGMLGGLVVMNGGSQRKGIGEQLLDVTVARPGAGLATLDREACAFRYRCSALQNTDAIVLEARFRYAPADPGALRREAIAIMRDRRRKFPKQLPNCGSVFLSNPALYETLGPPGRAIEAAGLKGLACGGAMFSPHHANFIVNQGDATSDDVLRLIHAARRAVFERTGLAMDCEVRHLPPEGALRPAHVSAEERFGDIVGPIEEPVGSQ